MTVTSLIARQAGVITRRQALAAGFTRHAVDHRVRVRLWWPLHPQVYLVTGHAPGAEVAARAAVLWGGDGAVLDGPAAAWWHGMLAEPPPVLGLTRPPGRRPHGRPTVGVRIRALDAVDVVRVRGLPVTAPPLTVLDTAVALGVAGPGFLDRLLAIGFGGEELQAAHDRQRGAGGSSTAGRLLAAAAERVAGPVRHRLLRLLRAAGREGWTVAPPIPGAALAIVHARARVAVFVDGWAGRPAPPVETALRATGWTVLRCTAADVTDRPRAVLAAATSDPRTERTPAHGAPCAAVRTVRGVRA